MTEERKYLPIRDFIDLGLLQEINRLVMHPAGYALATQSPENEISVNGEMYIWDYSEDPEGMLFVTGEIDTDKMVRVKEMIENHIPAREILLNGRTVQTQHDIIVPQDEDLIPCCEHCPKPVCKTSFFQGGHNGPCTDCRDKFKKNGSALS